ncbi:MAG: hypothetical protein FWD66_09500 [Paludibacter sp.]|nr:hypothetical protein [Paludibacter sp.]
MKKEIILLISLFSNIYIFSQQVALRDTISEEEFENFLGKSFLQAKTKNLEDATVYACECINKATHLRNEKSRANATKKCIESQVFVFQFISKLADIANLPDSADNSEYKLRLSQNKKSAEFQKYYDEITQNLIKKCDFSVIYMIRTTEIDFKALSDNPAALKAYEQGEQAAKADKWKSAAKNYEKSVSIDNNFALAWEKLALAYRHLNQGDKATSASKRAKEIRENLLR